MIDFILLIIAALIYAAWAACSARRPRLTPGQRKHRHELRSRQWKLLSDFVRRQQHYTCQYCGRPGIEVHHTCYVDGIPLYGWLYWELGFLKLACRDCHESLPRNRHITLAQALRMRRAA